MLQVEAPAGGPARQYRLAGAGHEAYLQVLRKVAADFGARAPKSLLERHEEYPEEPRLQVLIGASLREDDPNGFGDPCVLRTDGPDGPQYHLIVTSNDAPETFPIYRSKDLRSWTPAGCAFPPGAKPAWALEAPGQADFWAPELHKVGEEFWLCFAAREHDGELSIGLARAGAPDGPYATDPPLVRGGVIDPHLLVDEDGARYLLWKEDRNAVWPPKLAALLAHAPGLAPTLFEDERDQRTAALAAALWPYIEGASPMQLFFWLQTLIEAVVDDIPGFRQRMAAVLETLGPARAAEGREVLSAMCTRILGQRLSEDGRQLLGRPETVLTNDQPWEGHLVEGAWVTRAAGRYYLFYAGNDFSTADYGIGVAVGDHPLGPYRKGEGPLLRSTRHWWGPGHPSVAVGPDGRPMLFLHAFAPGRMGYKVFRALVAAAIEFAPDGVRLAPA